MLYGKVDLALESSWAVSEEEEEECSALLWCESVLCSVVLSCGKRKRSQHAGIRWSGRWIGSLPSFRCGPVVMGETGERQRYGVRIATLVCVSSVDLSMRG